MLRGKSYDMLIAQLPDQTPHFYEQNKVDSKISKNRNGFSINKTLSTIKLADTMTVLRQTGKCRHYKISNNKYKPWRWNFYKSKHFNTKHKNMNFKDAKYLIFSVCKLNQLKNKYITEYRQLKDDGTCWKLSDFIDIIQTAKTNDKLINNCNDIELNSIGNINIDNNNYGYKQIDLSESNIVVKSVYNNNNKI